VTTTPDAALSFDVVGKRLRELRLGSAWSLDDLAEHVPCSVEELRRCEEDPQSADPFAVGVVLHWYGLTMRSITADDWAAPSQPLLKERSRYVAGCAESGSAIAKGLYVARAWSRLYAELDESGALKDRPDFMEMNRFGGGDVEALRALMAGSGDPREHALMVRSYFNDSIASRFPLHARAFSLGVVVLSLRLPASARIDGCYQRDADGTPVILLNRLNRPPEHPEAVAAHELYHYLVHDLEYEYATRDRQTEDEKPQEERDADDFADELLLPSDSVTEIWRGTGEGAVDEFAKRVYAKFEVSRGVLLRQCHRLGLSTPSRLKGAYQVLPQRKSLRDGPGASKSSVSKKPSKLLEILHLAVQRGLIAQRKSDSLRSMLRRE